MPRTLEMRGINLVPRNIPASQSTQSERGSHLVLPLGEEAVILAAGRQGLFSVRANKKGASDVEQTKDAMKM